MLMDTVKINLSWSAFTEIRDKYPERVLNDIHSGNFHFTADSVIGDKATLRGDTCDTW